MTTTTRKPIIAIDGPAGAGKTTAAKNLAKRLELVYLDTGATFRAVALKALRAGVELTDEERVAEIARAADIRFGGEDASRVMLDGEDVSDAIREQDVANASSVVATHRAVREILVNLWRKIGEDGGIVLEGRDIGTVVFPSAEIKYFLDARPEARARRRFSEQSARETVTIERVTNDLRKRDEVDRTRAHSPLRQAEDAVRIDTTDLTPEQTLERMLAEAAARLN